GSTRMGRPKALLPIPSTNEVFLARLVRTHRAAGVEDVLVVGGGDSAEIGRYMARALPEVRLLVNPEPAEGQLSSLLVALSAVDRPGVQGLLVALIDHPLVASDTIRRVLDAYRRTGAPIVRPVRDGRHGHPVLFDRRTFGALRRANRASGAKEVVHAYVGELVEVEVTDEGVFTDIDTPADYERAFGVKLEPADRFE
ncbi:MAG: nucleotidyltransferase family protein, partial [Acidobacteria bacterium]|nr:nucleotidyltransferase family protein [Acidobacteriota bacterium]